MTIALEDYRLTDLYNAVGCALHSQKNDQLSDDIESKADYLMRAIWGMPSITQQLSHKVIRDISVAAENMSAPTGGVPQFVLQDDFFSDIKKFIEQARAGEGYNQKHTKVLQAVRFDIISHG